MKRHDSLAELIENIIRLRRAERAAGSEIRAEITPVRAFLEASVGPTISRALAARLLGISQPALDRWVDKGDVASVLTPRDRREIPLSEIVSLLEDVQRARDDQNSRPVARVIRERAKAAREAVDLDRLVPETKPQPDRVAELQSLAYHRLVAERLDDQVVVDARARLDKWRRERKIHPHWASEWSRILDLPLSQIRDEISANSVRAQELRQSSPFTGVLTQQERQRLQRAVQARARE
jgi:hypothetical protein